MVGMDLAAINFGIGVVFLDLSTISIFQGFHLGITGESHPSHFLVIAPPSFISICIANFRGGYDGIS